MNGCFYGEVTKEFEDIIRHWNGKPILKKMVGELGGNSRSQFNGERYLNDMTETMFKMPFNSDFPLSGPQQKRLMTEIDKLEKGYKSKKISSFKQMFFVSDAVANSTPVSKVFFEKVNEAINYERNHLDLYLNETKDVAKYIRRALVSATGKSKSHIKKYLKKMGKLEEDVMRGSDEQSNTELLREYETLFAEHGGEVIGDYIKLIEMKKPEYRKAVLSGQYDSNLISALESSRTVYDAMGKVLIGGLDRMSNTVKQIYDSPMLPRGGRKYIERINNAKDRIAEGIEEGGYLPHYMLEGISEINYKMNAFIESKNHVDIEKATNQIVDRLETMIPDQARSRNPLIKNIWSKNPFFILNQYSKDVIAFNKISFIQSEYLPAIKRFQSDDTNPEFISQMRRFLDDTYQISTKGLMERPNWVNATVRSLMAAQTLKSMGLSTTGAIRNGASAAYFFTDMGLSKARQAVKQYSATHVEKLAKIEREQGFEFGEGGRELVTELNLPSSVNQTDIVFDPITGKVTYRDKGSLKFLDPAIDKLVGGSLFMHRATENMTRKWMFRIAWVQAYEKMKNKRVLQKDNIVDAEKYSQQNDIFIQKKATNFALKAVNAFAFEYASHAKARIVGGTAPKGELGPDGLPKMKSRDYVSAMGEVTFQFLHYPMSFINLQAKVAKGALANAKSGDFRSPEMKQALRFAGIALTVDMLSMLFNLDFTNTLENDTLERIKKVGDYLTADPEELKESGQFRGLISDFTGPMVGDMMYGANMFQLYDMPDNRFGNMLLGYKDYYADGDVPDWVGPEKKIDSDQKYKMWNSLNVEFARWKTKHIPAIRDGRGMDFFRGIFGWYPRSEQKERRTTINELSQDALGVKPFKVKKRRKGGDANSNLRNLIREIKTRE